MQVSTGQLEPRFNRTDRYETKAWRVGIVGGRKCINTRTRDVTFATRADVERAIRSFEDADCTTVETITRLTDLQILELSYRYLRW